MQENAELGTTDGPETRQPSGPRAIAEERAGTSNGLRAGSAPLPESEGPLQRLS